MFNVLSSTNVELYLLCTSVVLGGKNRGKSLLARVAVRKCDSGDKVVILPVNMKSGGSLFESLAASAVYQVLNKEDFVCTF